MWEHTFYEIIIFRENVLFRSNNRFTKNANIIMSMQIDLQLQSVSQIYVFEVDFFERIFLFLSPIYKWLLTTSFRISITPPTSDQSHVTIV